jgi:hypothetical protein
MWHENFAVNPTIFIANWCGDPPPGANLPVMAVFELILSKIDIVEAHSN